MLAIEIHQLVKNYGRVPALTGISLGVRQGEVFGFIGPNGAGKSTTIRILLDEVRADSGSARVFDLDSHHDALEIHQRTGYLPAELALPPKMTGRQVLSFFARLRGGVDWKYVDELESRFDAELDRRTEALSTGNRQKLGIIAAFMHQPELLILDEPITGLDPLVQRQFHQLVRETADQGRTVFLSSHTLSEVQRVADRVGIIRRGELVAIEDVSERNDNLEDVFLQFYEAEQPGE